MKIPIIDLANLSLETNGDKGNAEKLLAKQLDSVFSTVGFAYLTNHGINENLISKVIEVSRKFFELPDDVKRRIIRTQTQNGYLAPGREILYGVNKKEIRESYDVLDPEGPFPDAEVPELRPILNEIYKECHQLSLKLLQILAIALGSNRDFFTSLHKHIGKGVDKCPTGFRTLSYPALADEIPAEADIQRCGEHSDYGTLTLLFQDDVGGLEVLSEGKWIPVTPVAGTIIMNLGDMMQVWTADKYKATVHRVGLPEDQHRRRSIRQSFAFFVHPDNEVIVSPMDGSDKYPPTSAYEHLHHRYAQTYK